MRVGPMKFTEGTPHYTMLTNVEIERLYSYMVKNGRRDHRVVLIHASGSIGPSHWIMDPEEFFAAKALADPNRFGVGTEVKKVPENATDITDFESW